MRKFTTSFAICVLFLFAGVVHAQDRVVSIPDIWAVSPDDNLVAAEITSALRSAVGSMRDWRVSGATVPFIELMRACGATTDAAPDVDCLVEMNVRLDREVAQGFVIFAILPRSDVAGPILPLQLSLYDVASRQVKSRIDTDVDRIMPPNARHNEAAEWIRLLSLSVELPSVEVSEPSPEPEISAADFSGADTLAGVFIGTALASAIAAVAMNSLVLGMNGDERYNAYRDSWDASRVTDVCQAAADDQTAEGRYAAGVCGDATRYELLSHVLWAATALLGTTGLLVCIIPRAIDPQGTSAELALTPILGSDQAGLDLRLSF
jgi:hypothetical protein